MKPRVAPRRAIRLAAKARRGRRQAVCDREATPAAGMKRSSNAAGLSPRAAAELMRRSLGLDSLACPQCGGRLTLIALIEDPAVIARVLRHLGLPTDMPEAKPGRAPPLQLEVDRSGNRKRWDCSAGGGAAPGRLTEGAARGAGPGGNELISKIGVTMRSSPPPGDPSGSRSEAKQRCRALR